MRLTQRDHDDHIAALKRAHAEWIRARIAYNAAINHRAKTARDAHLAGLTWDQIAEPLKLARTTTTTLVTRYTKAQAQARNLRTHDGKRKRTP